MNILGIKNYTRNYIRNSTLEYIRNQTKNEEQCMH